jgi:hypothetical protein
MRFIIIFSRFVPIHFLLGRVFLTSLFSFLCGLLLSQEYPDIFPYRMGDTLYVNAKSGLNLRDVAGGEGVVLGRLAFADTVVVRDLSPEYPVSAADGRLWAAVKNTLGGEGYVAIDYVSHLKPIPTTGMTGCGLASYLTTIIQSSEGELCTNKVVFDDGRLDDGKSFSVLEQAFYGRATTIEHSWGYEQHTMTIRSVSISISVIYNLLDALIAQNILGCEDTFDGRPMKPENLRLWQDENYRYRIACEPLGLSGNYESGNLVITLNLVDL